MPNLAGFMKKYVILFLLQLVVASMIGQESHNIRLMSRWFSDEPPTNARDSRYNDCWGFVQNGEEFGVIGSTLGTHIIHLPLNNAIKEVAFIPGDAQGSGIIHRDYASFNGYLYAVCDQSPSALQVIDLSQLPDTALLIRSTDEFFSTAHNIYADEFTGKLYVSGSSQAAVTVLSTAEDPSNPSLLNQFDLVEYVHDTYARRDTVFMHAAYEGMWVFDFSNSDMPQLIGNLEEYPDQGYNHSGWLNDDGSVYVFADETQGKKLKVCDVSDISQIEVTSLLFSGGASHTIPHNVVIEGNLAYVSYYFDGLQVFDISDIYHPVRVAWYDTYEVDEQDYRGAWGVHKGLPSGRILVSDRYTGLYVFRLAPEGVPDVNDDLILFPNPGNGSPIVQVRRDGFLRIEHRAFNALGQLIDLGSWRRGADTFWFPVDLSNQGPGNYYIEVIIDEGTPKVFKYIKTE